LNLGEEKTSKKKKKRKKKRVVIHSDELGHLEISISYHRGKRRKKKPWKGKRGKRENKASNPATDFLPRFIPRTANSSNGRKEREVPEEKKEEENFSIPRLHSPSQIGQKIHQGKKTR